MNIKTKSMIVKKVPRIKRSLDFRFARSSLSPARPNNVLNTPVGVGSSILDWVMSLWQSHAFYNDQPHGLFRDTEALRALIDGHTEPCIIFSFEDSAKHAEDPSLPLLDSVVPFPADNLS